MDVVAWLADLGLAEHAEAFAANGINHDILPDLSNEDLKDLGVTRLVDRKRLLKAIEDLRNETQAFGRQPASSIAETGDHRQVTVLFADLAGFTRLTRELGAEEIHLILNRYFEAVDAIITSYGGVVDKHIGDNVMAVFGAPVAHDDDPVRAVRAAVAIHDRMVELSRDAGRFLQAHIGVANGQVVASPTGSETHRQYTVTGDSVNLAARLQDKAEPGETLISDSLYRAVSDRFESDLVGDLDLRGITPPVRVWKVGRIKEPGSAQVSFVGRRAELAQFAGLIDACQASRLGQTLIVRGEAGIGKTRLVDQFSRTAAERGFAIHRVLVLDFGSGETRDPVRSLLSSLLGVRAGADQSALMEASESAVRANLVSTDQRVFLEALLNLPRSQESRAVYDAMSNAVRAEGKRATVCELLARSSARIPRVVIIEDVHWADPSLLTYLSALAATIVECPAVMIMTSRPENCPLDQEWTAGTGGCPLVTINLGPLRKDDAFALAASLVDSASQLARDCVERAAGNPLFLEHLLRDFNDRAGEDLPASIQSLVLARLDRLSPVDKQALQAASVLGQRFSIDALRHLIKDPSYVCRGLTQRHLVSRDRDDYTFTHALVQEGVYHSLLKARRTELHTEAAGWFEGTDLILRAQHLDRANDSTAAAAYMDAAEDKSRDFQFEVALELLARAIELARDRAEKSEMLCLRGDCLRNLGATAESLRAFEAAFDTAEDDVVRCRAWIGMAEGLRVADRQAAAMELLDKAEAAATKHDLVPERLQIHYLRGNLHFPTGNIDGCLSEHQKALEFARAAGSSEGEALALGGLGDAYYLRGHMRTACDQFRACVEVCRAHGFGRIEVANRHMVGWSRFHLMEQAEALEDALEVIRVGGIVKHQRAKVLGLLLAAQIETEFGYFDQAHEHLEEALPLTRSLGAANLEAQTFRGLAKLQADQARLGEARKFAGLAVEIVRKVGLTFAGPAILATMAVVAENPDESRALLREAEGILDSGCVAHNHFWFGQLAIDHSLGVGDWDEADRYANRLKAYTRDEPLPWSDFLISRGRALADLGRGVRSESLFVELERLEQIAVAHGLKPIASGLKRARSTVSLREPMSSTPIR